LFVKTSQYIHRGLITSKEGKLDVKIAHFKLGRWHLHNSRTWGAGSEIKPIY